MYWKNLVNCSYFGCCPGYEVCVRGSQNFKQNHEKIIISHRYLQANKLIRKCLGLIDVVQQVITSLHLVDEELTTNKDNVA